LIKTKKFKILSWVMTLALIISNFIGMGPFQTVKATETVVLSEGFDSVLSSGGTTTTSVAPSGWTFAKMGAYASSSTGYYATAPSIKFGTNGAQAITPTFSLSSEATMSFWIRGASASGDSSLLVEKLKGASWVTVDNIIAEKYNTSSTLSYKLENDVKQVRFTYSKASGNVALDDFIIKLNSTTPSTVAVTGVTLDKTTLNLTKGQTSQLTAAVQPADTTNKNVSWASSNAVVASVDASTGLVTANAAGNSVITVATADGNKTAECAVTVTETTTPSTKNFDIVEVTDFHGTLIDTSNPPNQVGAVLANRIKAIKAQNPNTIIIGGGDLYQGSAISNMLKGVPVQKVMSNIGMEVTTVGNHEFDWGLNTITDTTMQGAAYSIICSNLYDKSTGKRVFDPYKIITRDGVRIAFIGGITNEAPTIILPANIANFDFRDLATEVNAVAKDIKDKNLADVIIAVVHEGNSILDTVAGQLTNVNAVFGGHSHSIAQKVVNNMPVVNANSNGKGYVDLKMSVGSDGSISFANPSSCYTALDNASGYKTTNPIVDNEAKAIIDEANAQVQPITSERIGYTSKVLNRTQIKNGSGTYGESYLGNWASDAVRMRTNSDVGMANNGGLRTDIPAGDITVGTMWQFMPFDNTIVVVPMDKAHLKAILEQAVMDGGKGIQVSGIKFYYDPSAPSGSRIYKLTKEDGTSISDNETLRVAAPDFIATGGDLFTAFVDAGGKNPALDTHILVRDALIDNIKANKDKDPSIVTVMDGRLVSGTAPKSATISVVATSDVHGNVYNYDYNTGKAPSKSQGLTKVSTYVKGLKASNPNVMLVDNGDTIQGTPLVYYYNMIDQTTLYPMAAVMGAMGYDTWTLGNHEFNYGLGTLNRVIKDAENKGIHMLSANTYKEDGTNFVNPYYLKSFDVNGKIITVGILGLTTKTIPNWEDPAHYAGLHFNDLVDEANKWVPIVKANGADVVIVTAHSGEEGASDVIPENQVKAIAQNVRGIDAIVAGHVHNTVNDLTLKNPDGKVVPVVEPNRWATNVSQIDIAVNSDGNVTGLTTKNVAMDNTIAEDPAIMTVAQPYQDKTLEYVRTKLGTSTGEFKGAGQLTQPTAIMELINKVQMEAAGTQLSIAAPLSNSAYIPQGDVTIQDIMSVYVYENFLYGVKMTGKQIKDWMELSVKYYKQVSNPSDPVTKDPVLNIADYNLDQLYGATYDIDLTQPVGSRIKNIRYNGKLVKDTDVFTVAINNYRYNGGGGFMAAAGLSNTDPSIVTYDSAKALGDDGQVRSLMMSYIQKHGTISPDCSNNWKASTSLVAQAKPETISVVATSDVHGNVLNYDYNAAAAPSKPQGLAKVSTYMNTLRANNPYTMLVDNGDTIQGTPLVYYYNMIDQAALYPMTAVMGAMKYDTWTLGNHEFNFGLDTLGRIVKDAKSQGINVLSGNIYKQDGTNFVNPYYIKSFDINGKTVKVGILGLTTKTVPSWEDPAHYAGLHFNDLVDEANKWVPIVKDNGADVVIVTAHSGEEGASDVIPENQIKAMAQSVRGIDAIVAGHVHNTVNDLSLKNPDGKVVPVVEPNRWTTYVSQINIAVDENGAVTGLTTLNKQMDNTIAEDPAIVSLIKPYQDATLAYLQTKLGTSTGEFTGAGQLIQPTAIMELINKVQMEAAGTQLSIAAPLSNSAYIPQGDVTIQNIMSVYVYENFLYGVKMTGKQVKDWMEYSVRYYKQVSSASDPIVKDPVLNIADYNLDQLYGATYDVDLTQPVGSKIKNLKYNGKLVKDTDVFTVAINNYRYNGGGGFMNYVGLSNTDPSVVTYDSAKAKGDDGQVRSLMMSYIQDHKIISPICANNWKLSTTPVVQQVPVTGVKLDKTSITIKTGTTAALVASVNPDNATNKKVAWKSSNESIATVDNNGVVTGILPGTAIITATTEDGGYTAKANVEVQKVAVKSVKLNSSSIIMTSSQTSKLIAAINPSNATFKDVIWTIQDNSIAQIKGIGNTATITPVHFGTTTVTVRTVDGNFTDSCKIIVLPSLAGKLTALTPAEALLVN